MYKETYNRKINSYIIDIYNNIVYVKFYKVNKCPNAESMHWPGEK